MPVPCLSSHCPPGVSPFFATIHGSAPALSGKLQRRQELSSQRHCRLPAPDGKPPRFEPSPPPPPRHRAKTKAARRREERARKARHRHVVFDVMAALGRQAEPRPPAGPRRQHRQRTASPAILPALLHAAPDPDTAGSSITAWRPSSARRRAAARPITPAGMTTIPIASSAAWPPPSPGRRRGPRLGLLLFRKYPRRRLPRTDPVTCRRRKVPGYCRASSPPGCRRRTDPPAPSRSTRQAAPPLPPSPSGSPGSTARRAAS